VTDTMRLMQITENALRETFRSSYVSHGETTDE